jgi:protein SCO1/2
MSPLSRTLLLGLLAVAAGGNFASGSAWAAQEPVPAQLRDIEIVERLGEQVPLDTQLVDHLGNKVVLRDYFQTKRPVILALNYYRCQTLCSFVLNGLTDGMRALEFTPGKQYQVVAVSIDPRDSTELAGKKREAYLQSLGRGMADNGKDWPFLTGTEESVSRLAKAVGFRYRWDEESKQYAHAAGIFVLTPDGRVSRTLYGITFPARDLRLALVEASQGGIGSPVDRLLLFCYHYDPETRRYGLTPMAVMRIGGVLTMVFLGMFLLSAWRRERRASVNG